MGEKRTPASENALFEEEMADVRPLERDGHAPTPVFRPPVSRSELEREVLRELDDIVSGKATIEATDSEEIIDGKVPGLDPRTMRQLKNGEFAVEADLDLHGASAEVARNLVEQFVIISHERGLRCIRVVHGRGRGSPGGVPVLKQNLPRWLARGPARLIVLAFTTASPHDGGAGASYVLLRKRGRSRPRGG